MTLGTSEFDTLLRSALLEAQRQDWADALEKEGAEPSFSRAYQKWRDRLLSNPFTYGKRAARPLWRRAVKAAACILLAVGISAGAVLVVSPDARAWVRQVVFEWLEDYFHIEYTGGVADDVEVFYFEPTYLPKGFKVTYEDEPEDAYCLTMYENDEGCAIYFDRGMDAVIGDNEHSTFKRITIGGNEAMLEIADEPGAWNSVIWTDKTSGVMFQIYSFYNYEELVKIAESVEYTAK